MGLLTALSGFGPSAAHIANHANNARMIGATKPGKTPQSSSETELLGALEGYLQDNARTPIDNLNLNEQVPKPGLEGFHEVFRDP